MILINNLTLLGCKLQVLHDGHDNFSHIILSLYKRVFICSLSESETSALDSVNLHSSLNGSLCQSTTDESLCCLQLPTAFPTSLGLSLHLGGSFYAFSS